MKVLWFSNTPALGVEYLNDGNKIKGTGGWLYSLNSALQSKVELSVAFHHPYKVLPFNCQKTKFFPIYTGNIILENLKKRFLHKVYDTEYLSSYLQIIEEVKPDLIHIQGTENSFTCLINIVNIPILISIQGNLTICHNKYCSGLNDKFLHVTKLSFNLKSLIFGAQNFNHGYKRLGKMALIEQKYLKQVKYITGRTDWDRRITRILAPESKYFIVNEILREPFYNNNWHKNGLSEKIILHTTNGDNYYKGFETLCHTLFILNEMGLNVEWRVAGISNNSLINQVVKRALKNKFPNKGLVLLGSITENELVNKLKEADIYLMTSHIENSPNNLCEAMILGMPCISTYAGGSGSMLENGKEGLLVQDGDPWVMAGAILEMRNNWNMSIIMGQNARKRALKRHDKKTIINALLETYQSIIKVN